MSKRRSEEELETLRRAEAAERRRREEGAWGVPRNVMTEFLTLEDDLGPEKTRKIFDLVKEMILVYHETREPL